MRDVSVPGGPGVRDDRGVEAGFDVPLFYDSLIAKLVVWGESRPQAIQRLTCALDEYRVVGVQTTLPFFRWLVRQPEFATAQFSTTYLDALLAERDGPFVVPSATDCEDAAIAAALASWFRAHHAAGDAAGPGASAWRRASRVGSLR